MHLDLDSLPSTFTFTQALRSGVTERKLRRLHEAGLVTAVARGLYRRHDATTDVDLDLLEIAIRAPKATICLTSALARHGLTDSIPAAIDICLPRGRRIPAVTSTVAWHHFDPSTFDIGRSTLEVEPGVVIGLTSPERSIVDAARLRHLEGSEQVYEALKRWLRKAGSSPSNLLEMARKFPAAEPLLREALEILL